MVYLLVFGGVLENFRFADSSPQDVPFATIGWDDSDSSCFHSVDNGVVNVRGIMNLEAKSHILIKHLVIVNDFQNLFFIITNL